MKERLWPFLSGLLLVFLRDAAAVPLHETGDGVEDAMISNLGGIGSTIMILFRSSELSMGADGCWQVHSGAPYEFSRFNTRGVPFWKDSPEHIRATAYDSARCVGLYVGNSYVLVTKLGPHCFDVSYAVLVSTLHRAMDSACSGDTHLQPDSVFALGTQQPLSPFDSLGSFAALYRIPLSDDRAISLGVSGSALAGLFSLWTAKDVETNRTKNAATRKEQIFRIEYRFSSDLASQITRQAQNTPPGGCESSLILNAETHAAARLDHATRENWKNISRVQEFDRIFRKQFLPPIKSWCDTLLPPVSSAVPISVRRQLLGGEITEVDSSMLNQTSFAVEMNRRREQFRDGYTDCDSWFDQCEWMPENYDPRKQGRWNSLLFGDEYVIGPLIRQRLTRSCRYTYSLIGWALYRQTTASNLCYPIKPHRRLTDQITPYPIGVNSRCRAIHKPRDPGVVRYLPVQLLSAGIRPHAHQEATPSPHG